MALTGAPFTRTKVEPAHVRGSELEVTLHVSVYVEACEMLTKTEQITYSAIASTHSAPSFGIVTDARETPA